MNKVMKYQFQHLMEDQQKYLIGLLQRIEDVFLWNSRYVVNGSKIFKLKENTKPVCLRPYLVPKIHE